MLILESTFPNNYRETEISKILDYITTGKFCQVIAVPGGGKATILRILAHNRNILKYHLMEQEKTLRFEYINLFELTSYDELSITKFLLLSLSHETAKSDDPHAITKRLQEIANKFASQNQTLVLLFDHFDEYQNQLPRSFFQLLRDMNSVAKYRFSTVFATRRDLKELIDPEILRQYYDFFVGNAVYIQLHDEQATSLIFSQTEEVFKKKLPSKDKQEIKAMTGGHAKLTKVIAELALRENIIPDIPVLLTKSLVSATLFELWFYLTAQEQHLFKMLVNKQESQVSKIPENLINSSLILADTNFTIPLFEEFIKTTIPALEPEKITYDQSTKEIKKGESVISDLLSPQEYRLMRFLVQNQGEIITRDEIIKSVWPDTQVAEGISDEAIDQMVFRLRKKIEDEPSVPKHVITIKGQGWRFSP